MAESGGAEQLSVLMAPMNFAMMPTLLCEALRRRDVRCKHIWYSNQPKTAFQFRFDEVIAPKDFGGRFPAQIETVKRFLDEDWDIFHFWNRSLFFNIRYGEFTGLDLPLLKARDKRIVWRFTGADVRFATNDKAVNPHSAYRYGLEHPYDEAEQARYLDFVKEYADVFVVPDAELQLHMPEAKILPRALHLDEWRHTGFDETRKDRPVVVHAPSNSLVKGSSFVMKAVEELHDEGLSFDHVFLEKVPHKELKRAFENADIVVDQLHTGMGVTTLEGWAAGKAVLTNMRRDVFGEFYGGGELPALTVNPDNFKDQLRKVITDWELRKALSERGRAAVVAHHDIEKVADQHLALYRDLVGKPPKRPSSTADADYLLNRAWETVRDLNRMRKAAAERDTAAEERLQADLNASQAEVDGLRARVRTLEQSADAGEAPTATEATQRVDDGAAADRVKLLQDRMRLERETAVKRHEESKQAIANLKAENAALRKTIRKAGLPAGGGGRKKRWWPF